MKIVTVIPLKKNVWRDNLSYFTAQDITLGSLVTVPVRHEQVTAVIIGSREVSDLKSELKTIDWQLKKLNRVKKLSYFEPLIIEAVNSTADYFASPAGTILKTIIPQAILDNLPEPKTKAIFPNTEKIIAETIVLQESDNERYARYKSLIRESFAKKQSVFLCLPTIAEVEKIVEPISRGIDNYVIVAHGGLSKIEQITVWKKALSVDHPILIISTPLFLSLPRADITTLIIDRENSPAYKMITRPFVDWRYLVEQITKQKKIRLILGDSALRSETIYRLNLGELSTLSPIKYRFISQANSQIIPLQTEQKNPLVVTNEKLRERIENALDHKENIFIYSGRRGLAPLTICRDCGTVMNCDVCHSPLAIHQTRAERIFLCHKCGQVVEIEDECRTCRGQRLAIVGFGVEKLYEDLSQNFPNAKIFLLDSDSVKTNKRAEEIVRQFAKTSGAILIGTELALNYLRGPIDNVIATSLDAFLALPDWRASEKLFSTLLRLKQLASKHFIIQTRQPEEKIFAYINDGNLIDFYRDEISERRELGYPPFKVIIKVSLAGKASEIKKEMTKLANLLTKWKPLPYPDLAKNSKGLPVLNILLRLSASKWPDPELLKILKSLTPNFVVNVDPQSIL